MAETAVLGSFSEIPATEWDALAGASGPFLSHDFLMALEVSASVGRGTGWQPQPVVLRDKGRLRAATPLFVKGHSQGEYVFDHGWAEAFARAGGRYYPKLQVAVPFTPVTGPRFLGAPEDRRALWQEVIALTAANDLSSAHCTFCTAEEAAALEGVEGTLHRIGLQYHWENPGYRSFDDFLSNLSSRKRKMIRKERAVAQGHGLKIQALNGPQILNSHWEAMWQFYQDTGQRKWGRPYLTRAFFDEIQSRMAKDVLLVLAFDGDRPVAGALNFIGEKTLFGRYWGALGDYPCLHFELCYYQAMDYAIEHGLRVEAGAQGEHKIARGYLPATTHSLHWIANPGFRRAVAGFLAEERRALQEESAILAGYGPYRAGDAQQDEKERPCPQDP